MSLQPPPNPVVGQVWVDPITTDRSEWNGQQWVNFGPNAVYHTEILLGPKFYGPDGEPA